MKHLIAGGTAPMLQSFQAAPPADMRSFASSAQAPFGMPPTRAPSPITANPLAPAGHQPVYHMKISATPVHSVAPGTPYTVTAGGASATTADGPVVAHAAPNIPDDALVVLPLDEQQRSRLGNGPKPVERPAQPNRTVSPVFGGGEEDSRPGVFVNVYGGRPQDDLKKMFNSALPHGLPSSTPTPVYLPQNDDPLSRAECPVRPLDAALLAASAEASSEPHSFSWILPAGAPDPATMGPDGAVVTGSGEAAGSSEDPTPSKGFLAALLGKTVGRGRSPASRRARSERRKSAKEARIDRMFRAASHQLREDLEGLAEEQAAAAVPQEVYLSEQEDEALGLPAEIRPKVKYGGLKYLPPLMEGYKRPLDYKLHAIEIHQFLPLPGLRPNATAIRSCTLGVSGSHVPTDY